MDEQNYTRKSEYYYGDDNHAPGCDKVIRSKWSGVSCKCGARWFCY